MAFCPRLLVLLLLIWLALPAQADYEEAPTPPRLSYYKGDVAVYHPQDDAWEEARLNLPLAEGDALDSGAASRLELQLGSQAYIRADSYSRFQLAGQQVRSLRIDIESGRLSFDLRDLPEDDYLVDVSVHGTLFTLERPGYYRFDVDQDIRLSVRQGGLATVIPSNGESLRVHSAEALWMSGERAVAVGQAGSLDQWDRWNLSRTDDLVAASSSRYLPSGIAGAYELDRYGSWTVTATYGAVWAPYAVVPGWVPYSSGHWVWHPYYQWTWIDDAPWGWAPFHYGRWIYLGGRWVWAPGPLVRRPVYSPALVAFFYYGSQPCWVTLGWGEPVVPWWGHPKWKGKPSWHGWGGPKIVNRKPVKSRAEISPASIVYVNSQQRDALVTTAPEQFGRRNMEKTRLAASSRSVLKPAQGMLPQVQREGASSPVVRQPAAPARIDRGVPQRGRPEQLERSPMRPDAAVRSIPPRREVERFAPGTSDSRARSIGEPREPARMVPPAERASPPAPTPIERSTPPRREPERAEPRADDGRRSVDEARESMRVEPPVERPPASERVPQLPRRQEPVMERSTPVQEERGQATRPRSSPYGLDSDYRSQRTQPRDYRLQPAPAGKEQEDGLRGGREVNEGAGRPPQ